MSNDPKMVSPHQQFVNTLSKLSSKYIRQKKLQPYEIMHGLMCVFLASFHEVAPADLDTLGQLFKNYKEQYIQTFIENTMIDVAE